MLPGPMVRRELKAAALRRGQFALRTALGLLLASAALIPIVIVFGGSAAMYDGLHRVELRALGEASLGLIPGLELMLLAFLIPGQVAGAIAEEWERNTLPFLLISRLTRLEIVLAKLVGRMLPALSLASVSVPLIVWSAWAAGLPIVVPALVTLGLFSTVAVMGALSIAASARHRQVGNARGQAVMLVMAWLAVPPVVAVAPIRVDPPWDELVAWVKRACDFVAPSSPLSLLTDNSWIVRLGLEGIGNRLWPMIGLQAVLILIAVLVAVSSLGAREPYAAWWDPYRGYRPPCGDDPIFWREYDLPSRRGGAPRVVIWLRYAVALIRTLVTVVLRFALVLLVFGIPLGIAAATVWFAYPAFREVWAFGYSGPGPFNARMQFNLFIRGATAVLGFPFLMSAGVSAESRISLERAKGTWPILLTTPLSGEEILRSKIRVTTCSLRSLAWLLGPMWVVGVACGAVHPAGALLAALDLTMGLWLGVALGTRIGVRPAEKPAATTTAALQCLAVFAIYGSLVLAALFSREDLQTMEPIPRFLAILAVAVIPAVTGYLAWWLTRQSFQRFDEWVDRPRRGAAVPVSAPTSERAAPHVSDRPQVSSGVNV